MNRMAKIGELAASLAAVHLPAHRIIMGVLFASALFVGYELLPGQVQRVAMLERDGQSQQARDVLERSFAEGDRSQRTLLQLQALYEQLGQLDRAKEILGLLQGRYPRDSNILKRAAGFYKMTQDETAYIATLRSQLDLRYSENGCRELLGLLRLHATAAQELAALQLCRQRGYRRPDDMLRLASMLAADGDLAQSSTILRGMDDLRRLKLDKDRSLLAVILLELDQPREAYRRALRWLRGGRETGFALSIIDQMATANKHDIAIELAREISVPGDAISLAVAELMLDRGEPLAAKSYLRGWIEKSKLDNEELASRFIVACLDAEDPENAMAGAQKYGLEKLYQVDLVALAEALAATGRQQQFDLVRAVIRPEIFRENPLLGAALALQRGAPETSKTLLSTVAVDELDEWRLSLWARLMSRTGRTGVASLALQRLGVEPGAAEAVAIAQTDAQGVRVAVEPRLIRRPARKSARSRLRRFPQSAQVRARQVAPGQAAAPIPGGTVSPYDFGRNNN